MKYTEGDVRRTRQIIKHFICGYEYPVTFNHFKNNHRRCPNCAGLVPITKEQIETYLSEKGYRLTTYNGKGAQTKHTIEHISCGYQYPASWNKFKNQGARCPNCSYCIPITREQIETYLSEEGYRLITYNGNQYPMNFSHFKNDGNRCLNCCRFRSEKMCTKIFENLLSHKFPKVRPNFLQGLELDGYCQELKIAFEYNGIQHYEISPFIPYDTEEELNKRKERDQRKIELCNQQDIKLCVIPYTYNYQEPNKLEAYIKCWIFSLDLPL
jgi:hypothetical protein